MKQAVAALVMMNLVSPASASEDAIHFPSLTSIPFIISTTGDRTGGYIKVWGTSAQDKGGFSVEQLQKNKCAIHFIVAHDAKTNRIYAKDGTATISCLQWGETLITTEVPGTVSDSTGMPGLENSGNGEKAIFTAHSEVRIPLGSE